jgi:hypothetical protein
MKQIQPFINGGLVRRSRLRQAVKPASCAAAERIISKSALAIQTQSAGLFASVFRGKQNPLSEHRGEEEIPVRPLFLQPTRGNRNQSKSGFGSDRAHGSPESLGGFELFRGPIRDDAQVHIAIGARVSARVRAEEINRPQRHDRIHGLQATGQTIALPAQRGRQIIQQQFHVGNIANRLLSGKNAKT